VCHPLGRRLIEREEGNWNFREHAIHHGFFEKEVERKFQSEGVWAEERRARVLKSGEVKFMRWGSRHCVSVHKLGWRSERSEDRGKERIGTAKNSMHTAWSIWALVEGKKGGEEGGLL